jgi:acetolactate synthase-1/2/3 large subunit
MRVADYLVKRIADCGISHVFVLPGGGAMHLNDALTLENRIKAVPCHHEQACGIAAEAFGRIKESSFGVAMVTTGPGATNVLTPVVGAWIESVPLMILSGQVKSTDRLRGRPLRQVGVQEVDILPMVKGCTKYSVTLEKPTQVRKEFERALWEMENGRKGPVWIDVPLDIQGSQIEPESLEPFIPPPAGSDIQSFEQPMNKLEELLKEASRPLILAGHGVRLAGASKNFLKLIERFSIPVVTTWNAMDLISSDHPLCVGRPGVVAPRCANFAVQNCDLLISIGSRLDNIITAYNPRGFARGAKKIVVDIDVNEIAKLDMTIDLRLVMDAGQFIESMLGTELSMSATKIKPWISKCQSWKDRYSTEAVDYQNDEITHAHFVSTLSKCLPENTIISTGSSGLAVESFYLGFRNKSGQRVFLTSGLGSMGYGIPAAIGACLASNSLPMVCVESDGSLMLNLQELATLKGLDLPICLFVMNNQGYCSIRNTQRNYFSSRFMGTDSDHGLWMPNLFKLATAYDLPYKKITSAKTCDAEILEALNLPRPCIVDVNLVANEQLSPKVAALPQSDGSMLSMPLEDMSPLLSLEELEREMLVPLLPQSRLARINQ